MLKIAKLQILTPSNEDYDIDELTNRYEEISTISLEYDNAGNLTKDKDGYEYEYDYENRIVKITKSSGTVNVAAYAYDALGRRIKKVDYYPTPDVITHYYHNPNWQVMCEYDYDGQTLRVSFP